MDDTNQGIAKLNEELRELISETKMLIKTMDNKRDEVLIKTEDAIKQLNESIKHIAEENVQLQRVPKKIEAQLVEIIPNVGAELHRLSQQQIKLIQQAHQGDIEKHNQSISDTTLNLKRIKDEICQIDGKRIRRYFLGLGLTMAISVLASLGASYVMIEQFPHKVSIESPANVNVERSEVSLWHSKSVKTSGSEKNIKY